MLNLTDLFQPHFNYFLSDAESPVEWLLLQSSYPPHRWTPPRGMVEDGEAELTTALREVKEETGLLLPDLWLFEDLKREVTYQEWKF